MNLLVALSAVLLLLSSQAIRQQEQPVFAQNTAEIVRPSVVLPPLDNSNLFFASADTPSLFAAYLVKSPAGLWEPATDIKPLPLWGEESLSADKSADTEAGHDGHVVVRDIFSASNGRQAIVQMDLGASAVALLLDFTNRAEPTLTRLTSEGWGNFLGWHPDGQQVLYRVLNVDVSDPGLWIVNMQDGAHRRVEIPKLVAPEGLLTAAFSPDGKTIAYATSQGMGFGSELWLMDSEGQNHRLVYKDELTVVGDVSWSPNGQSIAFTNLLDSPVPFAEAGLWRMNGDGADAKFLAKIDGGRGQKPLWSQDSQQLFFVVRENVDNPEADYTADALVSSIQSVDVQTGEIAKLVPADRARQLDLSLTPEGDLFFVSDRGGALEVWSRNADGNLQQLTADGAAKRHPIFVSSADAQ